MTSTRTQRTARTVKFGEFELDVRAGELRRSGDKVPIQEQPLRLLALLVEHPGEVVLREEIRKRLWPNDTAVEVSHGINAAVLRLREALGESAENPVYIETVARRGYRFRPASISSGTGQEVCPTGTYIRHYRILQKLGSGGMGVVYRAEDEKLGRAVALKFLPPESATEPAAIDRFHREARAASALSHPNICTVYAVEEHDGRPVIVMEFLEGSTLAELLSRDPLPERQAIATGIQLASALSAAHDKGIVHRDLKPGNIVMTVGGVKVLDFGLARMPHGSAGPQVTQEGAILGTPNYMSPEQEQGSPAGPASDIYSLGLVLREMAGAAPSEPVKRILSRCLAQDPEARWRSAADLKAALEAIQAPPVRYRLTWMPAGWRRWVSIGAVCVMVMVLAGISWKTLRETGLREQVNRFSIPASGNATRLSLSPDGQRIAFTTGRELFVRAFDAAEARLVYKGEAIGTPFWSPDGRAIALAGGGKLRTVSLEGGPANVLGDINTNIAGAWGEDGTILIGLVGDGLYRIAASGGKLVRATELDSTRGEVRHLLPQFLPDRRRFLFLAGSDRTGGTMLAAGSLDSGESRLIMPVDGTAMFVPSRRAGMAGYLVFARGSKLLAQAFDAAALRPLGEPIPVVDSVLSNPAVGAAVGIVHFSATASTLAYRRTDAAGIAVVQNWMAGLGR